MGGDSYDGLQAPEGSYLHYQQGDDEPAPSSGSGSSAGGSGAGVGGGQGGAGAGSSSASKPTTKPAKPQWKSSEVIIAKPIFDSLVKSLGADGASLDFAPTGRKKFVFQSGKKKLKLMMPKGFGILRVDKNATSTAFLWSLLMSVVQSGEKVAMSFATTITLSVHTLDSNKALVSTDTTDIMREAGLTLASKDLTKKIYGSLLPPGSSLELTSQYDNFSMIYVTSAGAFATHMTVVHELLGHFSLASRALTYKHPDSLSGSGVVDNQGKPFNGTVIDFITLVVSEATANLRAAGIRVPRTPAPVGSGATP